MSVGEPFELAAPIFLDGDALRIAGFCESYTREQTGNIPEQWDRLNSLVCDAGGLDCPGRLDDRTYAIVYPEAVMRYVTGIALKQQGTAPPGLAIFEVPQQAYAVFSGGGSTQGIRDAWAAIFGTWLPTSPRKLAPGPMLEVYEDDWVKTGEFEIWIPLEDRRDRA